MLLGLSGGPDSLCLLHILKDLREELGFELYALHLNHRIRGAAADADAAWIKEYCGGLGITASVFERDIPREAKEFGISEEDAGRRARHELLRQEAARLGAKVALAHNRDDQAETVLLRILRGTGVHGLSAMEYERSDGLIRPLLDVPRSVVEDYCAARGLQPRLDASNSETDYTRNRVRLELLPQLAEYNPNIKEALVRLAANAAQDDACLAAMASDWYSENLGTDNTLPVKGLRQLDSALFARVIKLAFSDIGLSSDIEAVHIEALRNVVNKAEGGKTIEFPRGFEAFKLGSFVYFRRNCENLTKNRR